uniref:protein RIC-3 n=1 Tax=Monopterus albus TaxID=43700 RepID=UPI0009B46345|nr:protein RIC-3-like [Monopterus albus]
MLLPREKKEMGQSEVGPGFYSTVMHQLSLPEDPEQWDVNPSYSMTHSAEAMAKVKVAGRGKNYNLMAQVIPVYGFGVLLYILYIIYKLTCKGKTTKSGKYSIVPKAKMENKITADYELARLQETQLQTEGMMERTVSGRSHGSESGRKRKTTASKKEEKLLRQLRQFTQLMQEHHLEEASPEMEAEEVPYGEDWEGYPEETYPEYDDDSHERCKFIKLEDPPNQPTAEALAERLEQEEEDVVARKLSILQDEEVEDDTEDEEEEEAEKKQLLSPLSPLPPAEIKQERVGLEVSKTLQRLSRGKKQITFSDHKDVFHYPKEASYEEEEEDKEYEVEEKDEGTEVEGEEEVDEDDPLMEAESLQFSCEGCSNPEEEAEEDQEEYLFMSMADNNYMHGEMPKVGVSGLRMRNRRET